MGWRRLLFALKVTNSGERIVRPTMTVVRRTTALLSLLSAVGCSTPNTITSQKAACNEIESEIAKVYALTKLGETRWEAWQELYKLLETAQLRACEVKTETPHTPMLSEQVAHLRIGGRTLECVKPNGVRGLRSYS
jgi:hypothetical protein